MAKKTTRTRKTQTNNKNTPDYFITQYMDYVLEKGKRPHSVYQFTKTLEVEEASFYEHFSALRGLEKEAWAGFLTTTLLQIQNDDTYQTYSVREKLLAFYFTFIEVLKQRRSYVLFCYEQKDPYDVRPFFLEELRTAFKVFAQELINEGLETGEIVTRPVIENTYKRIMWAQLHQLVNFWINDDSKSFEKTDAAIEKGVKVTFDLLGQTFLDSLFDFVKFTFQNRGTDN